MNPENSSKLLGTLEVEPRRLEAHQPLSMAFTFRTERPLGPGACLRFHIPLACPPPQWDSPLRAGYCACRCDRGAKAALLRRRVGNPKDDAFVERWGHAVYVELTAGELLPGDRVVLRYGAAASAEALPWGDPEPTLAPFFSGSFPVDFAVDPDGLRQAPYSGMLRLAETCRLEVAPLPACREKTYSCARGRAVVGFDCLNNPSTVQWKEADAPAKAALDCQIYFGDIHCHSAFSDGLGEPLDCYRFARDWIGLDFCAVTDHARYVSDAEWAESCRAANLTNQDGAFVTLVGYELSHPATGEKNLYYPGGEGPLLREMLPGHEEVHPIEEYVEQWLECRALMMAHLHARHLHAFYHPKLCRLIEVYSNWGCCEAPGARPPFIPAMRADFSGQYALDALQSGWRVGFAANSDDHMARPGLSGWHRVERAYHSGLTAVYAPALTRQAVFQALYRRHTYATSGARIRVFCTANGVLPGESLPEGKIRFFMDAAGEGPLARLELIHNGRVIWQREADGALRLQAAPELKIESGFCYLRAQQQDGHIAWVSPFYVKGAC